jgi:hypothetical protein
MIFNDGATNQTLTKVIAFRQQSLEAFSAYEKTSNLDPF